MENLDADTPRAATADPPASLSAGGGGFPPGGGALSAVYQIIDWDVHFEFARSREIENPAKVLMPNKQHGMGFCRVTRLPGIEGAATFGFWCLLLQACSRQLGTRDRPRAGWLTDDGTPTGVPWDADDLALRWCLPVEFVQRALDLFCSPKVGWMRKVYIAPQVVTSSDDRVTTECRSSDDRVTTECRSSAAQCATEQNRTEQNGTGVGGITRPANPPPPQESEMDGQPESDSREDIPAKAPGGSFNTLKRHLGRLGMVNTEKAAREWADAMQGRGGCRTIQEALDGIGWIQAKALKGGTNPRYFSHTGTIIDEWAAILDRRRAKAAEQANAEGAA